MEIRKIQMYGTEKWSEETPYSINVMGKYVRFFMIIGDEFSFCLHETKRHYFSLSECILIMENFKDIMLEFGGDMDIILTRRF